MKVTWKKKKQNVTTKNRPLTMYKGFPFDHQNDPPDSNTTTHEQTSNENPNRNSPEAPCPDHLSDAKRLAEAFQSQGTKLAEEGKYREALGKWETALTLMPESGVLQEQKAQVLLEIGDAWCALKAATRATELEPSWAEAWITLGRAQLNFGEPDSAIQSFDRALAIKPDSDEAQDDRRTALHLVKRRKLLHSSGLSTSTNRYVVGDKSEGS